MSDKNAQWCCTQTTNIFGQPLRGCAGIIFHSQPPDQACGSTDEQRASCLHHEPQCQKVETIEHGEHGQSD